jgi:hypothetical protein
MSRPIVAEEEEEEDALLRRLLFSAASFSTRSLNSAIVASYLRTISIERERG